MTVKQGQLKITTDIDSNNVRTKIYNIVEKTDGSYAETLTELVSMEVVYTDDTGRYVVDSASELGEGYRVFPTITALNKADNLKENSTSVIEWLTALTEV